jgi:hypothetical protein
MKNKTIFEERRDWVKKEMKKFEKRYPKMSNSKKDKVKKTLKLKAEKKFKK